MVFPGVSFAKPLSTVSTLDVDMARVCTPLLNPLPEMRISKPAGIVDKSVPPTELIVTSFGVPGKSVFVFASSKSASATWTTKPGVGVPVTVKVPLLRIAPVT